MASSSTDSGAERLDARQSGIKSALPSAVRAMADMT
jgi:hypothetical protein